MIDELVKIHDNFTIEMKVGFSGEGKNSFNISTWFFVPNSLDVNRFTYRKEDFYKDVKSNIRLITPVFLLKDIAHGEQSPILSIKKSLNNLREKQNDESLNELEYQFKMFNNILKSSMREEIRTIKKLKDNQQVEKSIDGFIVSVKDIAINFRAIKKDLLSVKQFPKAKDFFLFADEFMSLLTEHNSFKLLKEIESNASLKKTIAPKIKALLKQEIAYKKEQCYSTVENMSADNNRSLISRYGLLKKYIESELFLNTIKKEDAFLIRQFVYSLAAGISMIFATVVAFSFQKGYGNFTIPFFVALVVGYMLKDRIKELSRHYFAHKLSNKYFDLKTLISVGKDKIGLCKESFDYINNKKVPAEILKKRNRSSLLEASNKFSEEQIMLYRMQVETDNNLINKHTNYEVAGINNIVRYNIAGLTNKMDNPEVPLYIIQDNDEYDFVKGDKVYFINVLLQLQHKEQNELKHYRLVLNRDGIKEIEKIK